MKLTHLKRDLFPRAVVVLLAFASFVALSSGDRTGAGGGPGGGAGLETAPHRLPFQGRLLAPSGEPAPEGPAKVLFSLYPGPTGVTALWESGEVTVQVAKGGMVNVLLGDAAHPLEGVDFSSSLYLGVRVDDPGNSVLLASEPEMLPRVQVLPALFAHRAGRAQDSGLLNGAPWSAILAAGSNDPTDGFIRGDKVADGSLGPEKLNVELQAQLEAMRRAMPPVGSVVAWLKSLPAPALPEGWVECNGQTETLQDPLSNTSREVVVPNLNGKDGLAQRFLRGSTTSGKIGGEDRHTLTIEEMPSHAHTFNRNDRTGSGVYYDLEVALIKSATTNTTNPTGGDKPHNILPSYYEVVWILRVK
ncbi:MAG: hypothetical protein HY721_29105 [Planctomycetes bacterium]|nr:hypothetical protein [Planctomycetota bacterium]